LATALFEAELIAVTYVAVVAGSSVPTSVARRWSAGATRTVGSNTTLRPTLLVARWIWAQIGTVGRLRSPGVLAKRAPTVRAVSFVAALGMACRNRSGSVEEEDERSDDLK
jgi:hypothetical protein